MKRQTSRRVVVGFLLSTWVMPIPSARAIGDVRALEEQVEGVVETIEKLKPMCLETPIVRDGQPAALIAAPPGEEYARLSEAVRQAVESVTGVSLKVLAEGALTESDWRSRTVIAMGNLMDSRFAERLYRMNQVHADARYPGSGGFVVRTVHDPWGTGANVLFLGGSDFDGVAQAVERFCTIVAGCPNGVLPPLLDVTLGETVKDRWFARRPDLDERREGNEKRSTRNLMRKAGEYGFNYAMSGHPEWALALRDALFEHRTRPYLGWDDTHMELWYALIGFDLAEESPALSDEDRLALTQYLLEILRGPEGVRQQTFLGALKEGPAIRHNHAMLPALDAYYGGLYYGKYYGLPEAEGWLRDAAALFAGQEEASKTECDATAYESTASFPLPVVYALAEPDYAILSNGTAARAMDRLIGCIDNRMELSGNGDVYRAFPMPLLLMANYYYRDGRYQWVMDRREARHGRSGFGKELRYYIDGLVAPKKPTDAIGVRSYAVDPRFYAHWKGPEKIPEERRFDKVSFRADFHPDRQYLLLDGLTIGSHGHDDANAIIRFTDLDRVFLVDDSYDAGPNLKDHNAVTVMRNGMRSDMPGAAELLGLADLPHTGFSQSVLRDHSGTDWTRSIVWLKDDYFVVMDEVRANEPGRYSTACLWRTLGAGELEGSTMRTRQDGARLVLDGAGADEIEVSAAGDPFLRFWRDYPHCEPHINVVRQTAVRDLVPGQVHTFTNLMYAASDSVTRDYTLHQEAGSWGIVDGGDGPALVGAGAFAEAGLHVDAAVYHIGASRIALSGATRVGTTATLFGSEIPVEVEWDLSSGTCVVVNEAGGRVGFAGEEAITEEGAELAAVPDEGLRWVTLRKGRHRLDVGTAEDQGRKALAAALGRLAVRPAQSTSTDRCREREPADQMPVLWRASGDAPVTQIVAFGQSDHVLVGDLDGVVRRIGSDGGDAWRYDLGSEITAIHVARLNGEYVAVVGSRESDLCVLSAGGEARWRIRIPHLDPALEYRAPSRSNHVGGICSARANVGQVRILVGVANGWLRCFDANGEQLWEEFGNARAFDQIRTAPLAEDGGTAFVVTGRPSHFGDCQVYTLDGERIGRNGLDGWARATNCLEPIDGYGTVVCGTALGNLYLLKGAKLDQVWMQKLGDAVTDLATLSSQDNGERRILAASECGYAYQFSASGKVNWATDLGAPALFVSDVVSEPDRRVSVATANGRVALLGGTDGAILGGMDLDADVAGLVTADVTGDGVDEIVVGLEDGSVVALRVER